MYLLTEVESLELRRVESDVLAGWTLLCYAIHKWSMGLVRKYIPYTHSTGVNKAHLVL